MKIRAINRLKEKEVILDFRTIEEAKLKNPYFTEFKEINLQLLNNQIK